MADRTEQVASGARCAACAMLIGDDEAAHEVGEGRRIHDACTQRYADEIAEVGL